MQPGETLRVDIRMEQRDKIAMIARHRGAVLLSEDSGPDLPPGREMLVLRKKETL